MGPGAASEAVGAGVAGTVVGWSQDATVPTAPSRSSGALSGVAGYEVLEEIGRGSMGVVYKARQKNLDRLVALKTIGRVTVGDAEGLSRFVVEARALARLQHPNIIQIYEISLQQDLPFFTMELVEGGNLGDHLGGRPQPVREAARMLQTLAQAVHAAHQQGIVHRDLKPANILLQGAEAARRAGGAALPAFASGSRGGELPLTPKITDFGLAKEMERDGGQTQSGMVMGTPAYMAPEQAAGRSRDVGPAADVYALGAILYEMLTGRPPYIAESAAETVLLLFQSEPLAPSRLRSRLPRDLETICLKCLQKDARRRYGSAAELADDLGRFLDGEVIHARPPSRAERAWKWLQRRPALSALMGSAATAALALVALAFWHQADLRARLALAREEEQQARDEQDQLRRSEQLTRARAEVEELLARGEAALAREDWSAAKVPLARARDRVRQVGGLPDLSGRVEALAARAARQHADRERLGQFVEQRDVALFNAALFAGSDRDAAVRRSGDAARGALGLFGALPGAGPLELGGAHLSKQEQEEVRTGCHELLIVLAEVTARGTGEGAPDPAGRAREALRVLDHAGRLGLRARAYHRRRADYLALAGAHGEAVEERRRAESLAPTGSLDHFLLGEELYRKGDSAGAARALEHALQRQPGHFWATYYLALCRLKLRSPESAVVCLTACLAQRPAFPWLYIQRGAARTALGQHGAAEADFESAGGCRLDEAARYALLLERGALRIAQGRAAGAIDDLRRAVALRPGQYQGHANLSAAYLRAGRTAEARRALDRALGCEPRAAALYRTRARTRLLLKDDAGALSDLEQAIRLGPAAPAELRAGDHLERGRLLLRAGRAGAAARAGSRSLSIRPGAAAHRLRAEALLALGQHDEALGALDACLRIGPSDVEALCARASVRARLGQYQGAQADYSRAIELRPGAVVYAARGWSYLVAGARKLALADFDEALRRSPGHGDALAGRGLAQAQLGRHRAAAADAAEALRGGAPTPRLSYNAARIYAEAAARVGVEGGLSPREASALRRDYEARAAELLVQALEQCPEPDRAAFWVNNVLADPTLRSVRNAPGPQRLARRYGPPDR